MAGRRELGKSISTYNGRSERPIPNSQGIRYIQASHLSKVITHGSRRKYRARLATSRETWSTGKFKWSILAGGIFVKSTNAKRKVLLWLLSLIMLGALASCGGSDGDARLAFVAALTGAQEVPPNSSTATGSGTAKFDPASRILTADVTTTGIVGTAAHIHSGAVGISGPIVFPLTQTAPGSGVWSTTVTALTDAQVDLLKSGGYYFNVHSAALPNGEIRGQITAPASGPVQAPAPAPAPVAEVHPQAISVVDVYAKLEAMAAARADKPNWKTSIADLLFLLGMDHSYQARKELAVELGCPQNLMDDSAKMNTWLHKTVLTKIAENGGNIPKELLD
jgi:hypothetical protein